METAEHREPCESRDSRTDLGAPGGEIPPGDSTSTDVSIDGANFRQQLYLASTAPGAVGTGATEFDLQTLAKE